MEENMKEIGNETIRLIRVLTLLSIIIVLSAMAAIVSADDDTPQAPIIFFGSVGIDGELAEPETIINAYIDGKFCGSVVTDAEGKYNSFGVTGDESDDGKTITFMVGEVVVGESEWRASTTPKPQELDLGVLPNLLSSTDAGSKEGSISGVYVPSATTPTGADAQSASWENVTSAPPVTMAESTTPGATSTKKLVENPETKGLLVGFEAVFAIAGLLAVAYLIRRE